MLSMIKSSNGWSSPPAFATRFGYWALILFHWLRSASNCSSVRLGYRRMMSRMVASSTPYFTESSWTSSALSVLIGAEGAAARLVGLVLFKREKILTRATATTAPITAVIARSWPTVKEILMVPITTSIVLTVL